MLCCHPMLKLLAKWLLSAAALLFVAYVYNGVQVTSFTAAMLAALVIGLLNTIVRPILVVLTLPVTVLTLGLFLFVINAAMLLLTSWITGKLDVQFHVDGFWSALLGSVIITVVGIVLNIVLPDKAEIK